MHRTFFFPPLLLLLWKECSRSPLAIKPSSPFCPQFMPDHNWWKTRQITSLFVYSHLWYAIHVSVILINFSCWITDFKRLRRMCGIWEFEWKSVHIQEILGVGFLGTGNAQFQNLSNLSLFLRLGWGPCQHGRALTELLTVLGNLPAGTLKSIISSNIDLTFDLECKLSFELLKQVVDFLWELTMSN